MRTVLLRGVYRMQRLATCKTAAAAALPRLQLLHRSSTRLIPAAANNQQLRGIAVVAVAAAARSTQQQQQVPSAPTPRPVQAAEDAFYAEAASSFEQLGIIPAVAEALKAAGFARPSRVQASACVGRPAGLVRLVAAF
eukprot:GHRQ01025338.1.p1 GENE.GHRQ01025338.1~~GHRQ01025338.1.p1  ORF type:complete len:138 (+),score=33.94 GHRQ01025338.1:131-544(+)